MITAGYGRIRVGDTLIGAHQISWRLHYGPIEAGMVVCHNCPGGDNSRCVNPSHLYVASQTENLRDAARKKAAKTP
ncbi:MAG: HNH endonuclease [Planctomycetes bacterium]|nr:HNH endonuclease [Planctomycetota bacterium]MBI3833340.1 HNH endonuclease [Planctomycetota bacterium]